MDLLMHFSSPVEIEFDWHLTNACNFNCAYCFPDIKAKKNRPLPQNINVLQVVSSFNSIGLPANINMSGGEPFLFPKFIDLCKRLTEYHHIGLNTNLSTPLVETFADCIDPKKVSYIWAAVHLDERLKIPSGLEVFARRYRLLRDKGFNISAIYIAHPSKEEIFNSELALIKNSGVDRLKVKVFKGVYRSKVYPEQYSTNMRDNIIRNSGGYAHNERYLQGARTFKGHLCAAGYRFFKIWEDGKVQRCASDRTSFGNIYDGTFEPGPKPYRCTVNKVQTLSQCVRFVQ